MGVACHETGGNDFSASLFLFYRKGSSYQAYPVVLNADISTERFLFFRSINSPSFITRSSIAPPLFVYPVIKCFFKHGKVISTGT